MPSETPPVASPQPTPGADVIPPRAEATPEPAPAPAKGAEQIAEEARQKMAKMQGFWNRVAPEKEKKPDETKPAQTETKPAADATEKPKPETKKDKAETQPPEPAPEPEKPKRRRAKEEVDPSEIAEQTGRAIGDQIAKSLSSSKPAAAEPAPAAEPDLPDEFKRDVAVFEEMARQDQKRYGKIKEDLAKYAAAENKYIEKWEAEHPGETFDGDAPEHNEFYERIKPTFDQADFEEAKTALIEKRAVERAKKEAREEFQKEYETREQQRERAARIVPEVEREMFALAGDMAKEIDPSQELKDVAAITALQQNNPLLHDVMSLVHDETKPVLSASLRLFRGVEKFDPANKDHNAVAELVTEAEKLVMDLPIRERYYEGRLFATQADYVQMSPAEKAKHWYVGENELAALLRGRAISRTKAIYERESNRIKRYTGGAAATPKPNPPARNGEETPPQPKPEPKPDTASPSVSGRGSLPGDGQPPAKTPIDGKGWFFERHLRA